MRVRGESQPGFPDEYPEHFISRRLLVGDMLGVVIGAGWLQVEGYFDRSGEATVIAPSQEETQANDTAYRVGSWNMHNETAVRLSDLRAFAKKEHLDALMLQEVNRNDVQHLERAFPTWGIAYVLADTKQEWNQRGFGNAILTRGHKPKDVKTRAFSGKSVADALSDSAVGAVIDLVNGDTSFARSRKGLEENRAAVAVTHEAFDGEEERDVRLITAHIARNPVVHDDQLKQTTDFIKDNVKDGRPTVFCGDLNGLPPEIRIGFSKMGGFITEQTGRTSVNGNRTLDYCTYNEAGVLGLGEVKVDYDFKTDHYPVVASWRLGNREK